MKLPGHRNANMALLYVGATRQDLQREYQAARLTPRHLDRREMGDGEIRRRRQKI
jgi:hypothetical protein